jgi:hypothetical protein
MDLDNEWFKLAADVVNFTQSNLFLTGKAGTGKTTFLKYIKSNTQKHTAVVAPTGVAAINAGGVTMHSFFHLPFIPYVPSQNNLFGNIRTADKHALIKGVRFNREKIELINELELLIIDEVSMLRADMLDAIDDILRYYRRNSSEPFGGVQVLFIGDLFQLPPVASDEEWGLLKNDYASPFFFSAKVLENNPPLFIELKKMYRQNEKQFIQLLNNIRNNNLDDYDYQLLNERYNRDAMDMTENIITLTTHNRSADQINAQELNKLDAALYRFQGEIKGEFSDKALPTEMHLDLKVGAQVMFIKNDLSGERKYFNGKLATVKSLSQSEIVVTLAESHDELTVVKEKWSNIRYNFNKDTNKVDEEELGSFTQYPIRLAWAITIHKSQGLTFDKAIIDAGYSFAAGQVYVALSRCRTLDGVLLLSKIQPESIQSDERIIAFATRENSIAEIEQLIQKEKPAYTAKILMRTFDWRKLLVELEGFKNLTIEKKLPDKELFESTAQYMLNKALEQQQVAEKFSKQLLQIIQQETIDETLLIERVSKAKQYFTKALYDEIIQSINTLKSVLKGKSKVRGYSMQVNELEANVWKKLRQVQQATFGEMTFEIPEIEMKSTPIEIGKQKEAKGESKLESFKLYKKGKSIEEIAKQRGFANSTIEGHLSEFIGTGDISIHDFVNDEQIIAIKIAADELGYDKSSPIKEKLGDSFSYGQIRMVLNYLKRKK